MNSKWRNRGLWLLVIGVTLSVVKQVANLLGYPISDPTAESIVNIATTIINALAILGILSDPPQSPKRDENNDQNQNL
jgi:phi LC3 family holin